MWPVSAAAPDPRAGRRLLLAVLTLGALGALTAEPIRIVPAATVPPVVPRGVAAEPPEPADAVSDDPVPAAPTSVSIPRIGVEAEVIRLGLDTGGALQVPADFAQAGWWEGGSAPGEPGPAVIVGHVDSTSGPAVFARLSELAPGDLVEVHSPRGTLRFTVERLEQHPKDAFPTGAVYGPTPGPSLRLITCIGTFDQASGHYRDNLVVFAAPVSR